MSGEFLSTSTQDASGNGWRAIVQAHRQHVPVIQAAGGIGAGLLVRRDGLIVTNGHVVDGCEAYMLTFHDGTRAKASLVHRSNQHDLAVIRAAVHTPQCFDLDGALARQIEAGDDVLAIGHPRGLSFTSTRGCVSEPRRRLKDGTFVQVDVPINPGNSGGPLLDSSGRLVGLISFVHKESQGLSFAVPAADVRAYVLGVFDQLDRGVLPLPADEDINRRRPQLTRSDLIAGAVASSGLMWRSHETGEHVLTSPGGHEFWVSRTRSCLLIHHYIGNVDPARLDAQTLFDLLKINFRLNGPAFQADARNALCIAYSRPLEGMDMNEARTALAEFADALDEHLPGVLQRLGR